MTPYNNENITYKYTSNDIDLIDKAWELINILKRSENTNYEFRSNVIRKIKRKYSAKEFATIEKVVEKIYWNANKLLNDNINFDKFDTIKSAIDGAYILPNFRRSYINKFVIQNDNEIYLNKNIQSTLIDKIMSNRSVYETFMINKKLGKVLAENINYKYLFIYPFPNINNIEMNNMINNNRIKRINKMYYYDDIGKGWFKLIKN